MDEDDGIDVVLEYAVLANDFGWDMMLFGFNAWSSWCLPHSANSNATQCRLIPLPRGICLFRPSLGSNLPPV